MKNRNKPPRPTHPLLVAASALTRATDPASPSRLTVLRLLGDAYSALYESHTALVAIKARSSAHLSTESSSQEPLSRYQVEADMRFRHAHNEGSRALFSVTVTALIKLPSRGGPLRRRAIDIIKLASQATGPASAMAAVDRVRSHISTLKRLSWSAADPSDFEVSASILTLADLSTCPVASREVARESILFLLGQRVRQKCRRGDLSYAVAVILSSYPPHAPPDDRLVDLVLEYCLSSSAIKQGTSAFGSALLTAVVAPHVVNRGPAAGDNIVLGSARALAIAPTPTERAMWAIAVARASVTARRSTTFQLRKYGNSEVGSKFPNSSLFSSREQIASLSDASLWVSNEVFEESLVQVATTTAFSEGSVSGTIAISAILKMWLHALPLNISSVIPRTITRLTSLLKSVTALSALVDAVWIGVLKDLKPSQSPTVLDGLIPLLSDRGITYPVTISICAALISKFGRQALRESGLSTDYNTNSSLLIERIHEALQSTVETVRLGAARAMSAILLALPRTCSQFFTAVLQNLRIADMTLSTKPASSMSQNIAYYDSEVALLLGNSAAMSVLLEAIRPMSLSIPLQLERQSFIDILALLKPHHLNGDSKSYSPVVFSLRRRVAWGLIGACARGFRQELFDGATLEILLHFWTEELRAVGTKPLKGSADPSNTNVILRSATDESVIASLEDASARSAARAAALYALSQALCNTSSERLKQFARAIVGSCAGRVITLLSSLNSSSSSSSASLTFMGFSLEDVTPSDTVIVPSKRKALKSLFRALTAEASQLVQILALNPPRHDDANELCFLMALALAEEAQVNLGESNSARVVNSHLTNGNTTQTQEPYFMTVFSNWQDSLLSLSRFNVESFHTFQKKSHTQPEKSSVSGDLKWYHKVEDTAWLFSAYGAYSPNSEMILMCSARAIAAIIGEDLLANGTLIESLSFAKLSPPLCAVVSLELTKKLSQTHLAEVNRALAVLQVLVRRSLGLTVGVQMSLLSQAKAGRLYTPTSNGDGHNFFDADVPGSSLQNVSHSVGVRSTKAFSDDKYLCHLPFHNFHSRAFGIMHATRVLSSSAFKELSITGGPALWIGLVKRIMGVIRDNLNGGSPSQFIIISNATSALGALLEVVPEQPRGGAHQNSQNSDNDEEEQSEALKKVSNDAVNILIDAIESGKPHIQAASACALNNQSYVVASYSERLIAALLRAWASDNGAFCALGPLGRFSEEADVWESCFSRMWHGMGIREPDGVSNFFQVSSSGIGSSSCSFVYGAGEVMGACKRYWWPLGESSFHSVKELATDLVQWEGVFSRVARSVGLRALISIWSRRVDAAQTELAKGVVATLDDADDQMDRPIVDVDIFSLKDTSRENNPYGPYLDEVVYDALAPNEGTLGLVELRTAATTAVSEIFRGLGVDETCTNLQRLPETLFAAIEDETSGAHDLMETMVCKDARRRPRYWFGLCRAVVLGGERLNYGKSGISWDVSFRTKSYAVQMAVEAVDNSMAFCKCQEGTEINKHDCAFGFLRKIFDFVKQICSAASFDFDCCGHGCRLLQRVAIRMKALRCSHPGNNPVVEEFFEMWDPCVAMMHTLLNDRVPNGVVGSAATAVSELLMCSLSFRKYNQKLLLGNLEAVSSYIQALVDCNLRQRFSYTDHGEEVSMHTLLSLIGKYGRVVSALKTVLCENGLGVDSNTISGDSMKHLFFALCGDFVCSLSEKTLCDIYEYGGATIPPRIGQDLVRKALTSNIPPIILGAISSITGQTAAVNGAGSSWENIDAPGVHIVHENEKYEGVSIAALVWLLKHENWNRWSKFEQLSFCVQVQESMEYLFQLNVDSQMNLLRREAVLCLGMWSQTETLKWTERMSSLKTLDLETASFCVDVVLTIVQNAARNEFQQFQESETQTLCRILSVLPKLISFHHESKEWSRKQAERVLNIIFEMVCQDSVIVPFLICETKVQEALSEVVKVSMDILDNEPDVMISCAETINCVLQKGDGLNNKAMVKGGLILAAALSYPTKGEVNDTLFNLVVQVNDANQLQSKSCSMLGLSLDCFGVENCLAEYMTKFTENGYDKVIRLLHTFGNVVMCDEDYSIPVALRCVEAAIVAEGNDCRAVNHMGVVLYAAFLNQLIAQLPTDTEFVSSDLPTRIIECAEYLVDSIDDDPGFMEGWLSILTDDERQKIRIFLSRWSGANIANSALTINNRST